MEIITLEQARKNKLTHYFTGKPCRYGHISKRYVGGGKCVQCNNINQKKHMDNNRERVNLLAKRWRKNNPEKVSEIGKKYYEKNKERINALARQKYLESKLIKD